MARIPSFKVQNTEKGWRVNIPASISDTGNRQQRFFPTRQQANEFASSQRDKFKLYGTQSRSMSVSDTEDALKGLRLLDGMGVTLTQCAQFYLQHHDRRTKAPTLDHAFEHGIELRHGRSEKYLRNLKALWKRLPSGLLGTNIVDLAHEEIAVSLKGISGGNSAYKSNLGYLSAILGDYVKQGVLHENPCSRVTLPRQTTTDEPEIYTVEELRNLFIACRDYPDGKDRKCSECAVPFAFLAFAGIRPAELERLKWDDIKLKLSSIRLSGRVTKTRKTRNVRIHPTLKAWIATIPKEKRIGKIVPSRWIQKATRVKKEANLDGRRLQDALRHSFGSYLIAIENDPNALRADMGHKHVDTFYDYYHQAMAPEEAEPYWKVTPDNITEFH